MNENLSKEDLRKLIAMGKEAQVLKWMLAFVDQQPKDVRKILMLQSNRHQKLRKKLMAGSIEQSKANVVSAQISGQLIELLDNFHFPGQEAPPPLVKELEVAADEKDASSTGSMTWIFVVFGLLIIAGALLSESGFFTSKLRPEGTTNAQNDTNARGKEVEERSYQQQDWLGNWEAEMDGDGMFMNGTLIIQDHGKEWEGRFEVPADGNTASFSILFTQIEWEPGWQKMYGLWERDVLNGEKGGFSFTLDERKTAFKGSYYLFKGGEKSKTFDWKGEKIR